MSSTASTTTPGLAATPAIDTGDARAFHLRAHGPGDIGWIISRHGAIYTSEYGWSLGFEALVARIAADFIDRFDAQHEACWIAERRAGDGRCEALGFVMLVQARDDASGQPVEGVAQLRLLLVEPQARGLGVGARLVAECTRFARASGYRRLRLWTQSMLIAARSIYQREGYRLIGTEPHHSFGHDLLGEIWEMSLDIEGTPQ
jgi:GNAT superfamily N-acetyltransferase